MKRTILLLALLGFGSVATADIQQFMPENKLHRYDKRSASSMTEEQFNKVLDEVEEYYKPIVEEHGAELVVIRDWANPTVNAQAWRVGKKWNVHMFGGLARRVEVTADAFQLVACHEIGHHVAGFPFVPKDTTLSANDPSISESEWRVISLLLSHGDTPDLPVIWAANEGQSDYFSTQSCARELWKDQLEKNKTYAKLIPRHAKKICNRAWSQDKKRHLCYRSMMAGKSLADLLSEGIAEYDTPDTTIVSETIHTHPNGQCRLDTYMAGAICEEKFDTDRIPKNEKEAKRTSCYATGKKDDMGYRPKCWFK